MVVKFKTCLLAITLLLTPLSAQALIHLGDAQIDKILKLEPGVCAMEVGVLNNLVPLDLQDRVFVADHLLARLGALLDILDLDLLSGDVILLGSSSFEALTGIPVDIQLDDSECDHLAANVPIRLLNLLQAEIDLVILDPDFADNHAMVRIGPGDEDWILVSLAEDSLEVSNVSGDQTEVSSEISDDSGSSTDSGSGTTQNTPGTLPNETFAGGCSLGTAATTYSLPIGFMLVSIFGLFGAVRLYQAK